MQRTCLLILMALLVLPLGSAAGIQNEKMDQSGLVAPKVQGVTIRSIIMAPGRKSATIELLNQSGKTITAYAYASDITLTNGQHSKSEHMTERIGLTALRAAGIHFAPQPPDEEPIQPGEVRSEVFLFNEPDKVADLAITMEVVIYSDQTSESTNQWMLDHFIAERTEEAKLHSLAVEAITAAMQDEHPFKSAHDRLLKVKHSETDVRNLEPGYGRNFANADEERKYLADELAQYRSLAATLAVHAKIVR